MQIQIEPRDFATLMALPSRHRHDILEFLGSTPLCPSETGRLLRQLVAEQSVPASRAARPEA